MRYVGRSRLSFPPPKIQGSCLEDSSFRSHTFTKLFGDKRSKNDYRVTSFVQCAGLGLSHTLLWCLPTLIDLQIQ